MNFTKKILQLTLCFFVLSCLSSCDYISGPSCKSVGMDQVEFGDSIIHQNTTYYLYFRTTGWHEKVVFFEVYDHKPKFDECKRPYQEAFYIIDFDDFEKTQYVKEFVLQANREPNQEAVKIIYTDESTQGVSVYDVKFTGVEE